MTITHNTLTWSSPEGLHPDVTDALFEYSTINAVYQVLSEYALSGTQIDGSAFELSNCMVFLGLAKFINAGEFQRFPPTTGWVAQIKTGYSAGDRIKMTPVNFGDNEFISNEVYLVWQSLTLFEIEVTDTFQADFKHYARREASTANAVIDGTVSTEVGRSCLDSAYSEEKALGMLVTITRQRETATEENHAPLRLGWWNEDKDGVTLDQTMTVEIVNNGVAVDQLSTQEDNDITIVLPYVIGEVPVSGLYTVFKNGQSDCNWREQVELSRAVFVTDLSSNQLDGLIYAPSRILVNVPVDSAYKCEFTIPKDVINSSDLYNLGVILRIEDGSGNYVRTISLIERRIPANGFRTLPTCPMVGTIKDYDKNLNNHNAQYTIPVDRYRTELQIDIDGFELWAGTGSWVASTYAIGYEIKDTDGNVYHSSEILAVNGNYTGNGDIEASYNPGGILLKTTIRSPYNNNQGILDVANSDIFIEWYARFDFDLENVYIFTYTFTLKYRNYENVEALPYIEWIRFYDADTGLPIVNLCGVFRVLVLAKLSAIAASEGAWKMRGFIDLDPFGATFKNDQALSEWDNYPSPQSFEQLQEAPIETCESQFDAGGYGRMIIDVTNFNINEQWRVYVIADKAI